MFHLRTGQLRLKLLSFLRQGQTLEAAVMIVRAHRDEISLYQLTQRRVQRLLGYRKDFQQGMHSDVRIAPARAKANPNFATALRRISMRSA